MQESSPAAYLAAVIDSQTKRFPLEGGEVWHIGRGEQNTIPLDDGQVSRKHAMVQRTPAGEYYLIDVGSRNGTFVNRRRINAPVLLRPGDRITIGACEFLFYGPGGTPVATPAAQGETVADLAQRMITVLVADIRGFTGLSRQLGEARLSQLISAFFGDCGAVLQEHGAWAQKYIGDAVMAIWVHPKEAPELPELAEVLAALARLFEMAAGLQLRFGLDDPVRLGAGINTGLACVGNVGSEAASDYTALSDAVNLAFRLESATKEIGCDLVLGRKTYQWLAGLAGGLLDAHTVGLKGYDQPVQVYAASRDCLAKLLERLREAPLRPAGSTIVLDRRGGNP